MSGREQFMNREEGKNVLILSPLTGRAVPLEEVPDPVFSQKIIGDGMAVIPTEGKILSPADAQIVSVADTGHAYGLKTEEGVELLIHVGIETVSLKGECFKIHVKPGDTVKAGDLLAEVDLEFLEEQPHHSCADLRRNGRKSPGKESARTGGSRKERAFDRNNQREPER